MGVRFSHGSANWPSYTAFHAFRKRLAGAVGIQLERMQGFGGEESWSDSSEPLAGLLAMSDFDGSFGPEELERISVRLAEIAGGWPFDDPERIRALLLTAGMREAIQRGEQFSVAQLGRKRS